MLSYFKEVTCQPVGNHVHVQLLQTITLLFVRLHLTLAPEALGRIVALRLSASLLQRGTPRPWPSIPAVLQDNISNLSSVWFLLSNNHINTIILHKFDFSDDEVLAYYISLLRTLSMRANKNTIMFFRNEHQEGFPLYTEAIKLFNHKESMVRVAVRTLTLNIFRGLLSGFAYSAVRVACDSIATSHANPACHLHPCPAFSGRRRLDLVPQISGGPALLFQPGLVRWKPEPEAGPGAAARARVRCPCGCPGFGDISWTLLHTSDGVRVSSSPQPPPPPFTHGRASSVCSSSHNTPRTRAVTTAL